jgi:hypothetical protein
LSSYSERKHYVKIQLMDVLRPPRRPNYQGAEEKNTSKTNQLKDEEPAFLPPEEVAAKEDNAHKQEAIMLKKSGKKLSFKPRLPKSKKEWAITVVILLLLLGGAWWLFMRDKEIPIVSDVVDKIAEPEKPKTEASRLSGLQVDPELNKRPVTAVMIENSSEARPQSGLKESSLVFEAIAEGGITRFMALYQDTTPEHIGPIRSLRPYYLDWALPFEAGIVHVGGSPRALAEAKSLNARDLDQFYNGGSFDRASHRYAPHNVYTSLQRLLDLQYSKGFKSSSFTSFDRKGDQALAAPTARVIDINISSSFYNVHYEYDPAGNGYWRSQGGAPHTDEKTNAQIAPKVVIAAVMPRGIDADGEHTEYQTTGSGKVFIFQDGGVTEGTWSKTARSAQWKFTDAAGKTVALNPGQIWVSIVDTPGAVTFVP